MRRAWVALVFVVPLLTGCATSGTGVGARPSWSKPVQVEPTTLLPDSRSLYGVSCATGTTCVAVDEQGSAVTWRDGRWTARRPTGARGTLDSVSCSGADACVAMSVSGESFAFDGRSWSSSGTVGSPASFRISCPTATFCATVGAPGTPGSPSVVGTSDGTGWSLEPTPSSSGPGDRLMDVSCPTVRLCVAVNLDGHTLDFDGTSWRQGQGVLAKGLISISCPSSSFCMAVTASGRSATFDGTRWSSPAAIPGFWSDFARTVSCASSSSCTVLGLSGRAVHWGGGRWEPPQTVFPGGVLAAVSVSCPTSATCVAVTSKGTAAHT